MTNTTFGNICMDDVCIECGGTGSKYTVAPWDFTALPEPCDRCKGRRFELKEIESDHEQSNRNFE
jgi:DnaJ-class molecular chaperone